MKKIVIILLSAFWANFVAAQSGPETAVLLQNSNDGQAIQVKWIKETFFDLEGVDVYRKNENAGDWEKLNAQPLVKLDTISSVLRDASQNAEMLEEYLRDKKPSQVEDILFLILALEAMEQNDFADFLGNYFLDKTVQQGQTYRYKVQYNKSGKVVAESAPIVAKPREEMPPPPNFTVYTDSTAETSTQVKAVWTPNDEEFFAVNIWRTDLATGARKKMNSTPSIAAIESEEADGTIIYADYFFSSKAHEIGKTYAYQAERMGFFGEVGQLSEPIEIRIIDHSPPPIPADVEVTKKGLRQAWMIWSDVDTANIAGYNVLVGRHPDGPYLQSNQSLLPAQTGSYTHTIDDFGSHFFKLEIISKFEIKAESAAKPLDLLDEEPPAVPTNIAITPDTGFVKITWDAVAASDLKGYYVFRSIRPDDSIPFERVTVNALEGTEFKDQLKKKAKNIFYYKICAVDTSFNMSELTTPVSVQLPDVTPPPTPTLIKAKATVATVTLEWLPVLADDLAECEVFRREKTDGAAWAAITTIPKDSVQWIDRNVTPNTDYQYQVRAKDETGSISDFSNIYNARTKPDTTPAEGADKISANYQKKKKQVTIKWKEGEPNRKGSVVFRKAENGRLVALSPMINDKAVFVDKKVTTGKTYTYVVKTYYENGKVGASSPEELLISE